MKWKCTTSLLSVPMAAAVIGFGMTTTVADDGGMSGVRAKGDDLTIGGSFAGSDAASAHTVRAANAPERPAPRGLQGLPTRPMMSEACPDTHKQHNSKTLDNTVRCPTGPNEFARTWAAGEIDSVCSVEYDGFHIDPGDDEVCIRVYVGDITGPHAELALLAEQCQIIAATDDGPFTETFSPPINIPASLPVVVSISVASEADLFSGGMNELGQTAPTYLRGPQCGIDDFEDLVLIGFDNALIMTVHSDPEKGEDVLGACCLSKVDGEDPDPLCIDNDGNGVTADECVGIGQFRPGLTCDDVRCPQQVECPDDEDPCPACVGDLEEDGVVNALDLLELLACWGPVEPGCECADLEPDGVINALDLLELLANWGPCPTADGEGGDIYNEDEPCGERLNDGCNVDPPLWGPTLTCGDVVCGTGWTAEEAPAGHLPGTCDGFCGGGAPAGCFCDDECFGFGDCCEDVCEVCTPADVPECADIVLTRDTDWYPVIVKEKTRVTWEVHAEFPALAIIGYTEDCGEIFGLASATGAAKTPFTIDACLQPDVEYFLFVAPDTFDGLDCDEPNQWGNAYTARVICDEGQACEKGACCIGSDCIDDYDVLQCVLDGGEYFGDGSNCDDPDVECLTGGCCLGDVCVDDLGEIQCVDQGGLYRGDGTVCGGGAAADGDDNVVWCSGACCANNGFCAETSFDECINVLDGVYRGGGTTCADMVNIDFGAGPVSVPICRDCGGSGPWDGGQLWSNPDDVCDEKRDVDPFNGGCNFFPHPDPDTMGDPDRDVAFEQLCCGDEVLGRTWAFPSCADVDEGDPCGRNLDWRVLTLKEDSIVTFQVDHGFGGVGLDALLGVAHAGCPASFVNIDVVSSGNGLVIALDAGTYYVVVASEFSTAANPLLCSDTNNNWYQLTINCGAQNPDVCSGGSCFGFNTHPGFPSDNCSCDPDSCQVLPGTDTSLTNYCCPGMCDFCDGDACEILCNYMLDNELFQGGIGLGVATATTLWAHQHNAGAGDVIDEIRTNYSHTHTGGLPVAWGIFEVAPGGGFGNLIAGQTGLTTDAAAVGNGSIFTRQVFNTGGVAVSGEFIIAVASTGSTHPAPWSEETFNANVWIAADNTGANFADLTNPATWDPNTWSFAPSNNFGIDAIWNICGLGQ